MESFLGTWTAHQSKSRRHDHQFESATLRLEMSGDAVQVTHSGVNVKGEQESGTRTLHPYGKENAICLAAQGPVELEPSPRRRSPAHGPSWGMSDDFPLIMPPAGAIAT